jgi:hypothetical protein
MRTSLEQNKYLIMKNITTKLFIAGGILLPFTTYSAGKDLNYLIAKIIGYMNSAIYLILSLAVLMFVWNVYKYFISGSDDVSAKKEAGLYVMWSVIGFFVILSFWGLVNILRNTLNLDSNLPSTSFFGNFRSSNTNNSIFDQTPTTNVNPISNPTTNVNPISNPTTNVNPINDGVER